MKNKLKTVVYRNVGESENPEFSHIYQSQVKSQKDFNRFLNYINKDEYLNLKDDQFKIKQMVVDSNQEFKKGGYISYLEFEFEDRITAIEFKEYLEEIIEDRIGFENIELNINYRHSVLTGINSIHVQFPKGIKILNVERKQIGKPETLFNFEFNLISIINLKVEVKRQKIYTEIEGKVDVYDSRIGCVQIVELD